MSRQRFQVRTLTGFVGVRYARKPVTTFYVMDSVNAWRIVQKFNNEDLAHAYAKVLNNTPQFRMAEEWYAS